MFGGGHDSVDAVVLLMGVEDVKASKQFYVDRGLTVAKSLGGKYVEFDATAGEPHFSTRCRPAATGSWRWTGRAATVRSW